MKTTDLLLALLVTAAAAAPAAAKGPARTESSVTPAVTDSNPTGSAPAGRQICRRQQTTGARTGGERICLTRDQWRRVESGGSVTVYQKRVR